MIKVEVNCKIPENTFYSVTLNNQTKTIDSINHHCSFCIETAGNHKITIRQIDEYTLPKFISTLLFIITLPLQGLFHIFTFNTDTSWANDIHAYSLNAILDVSILNDTTLNITIIDSCYSKGTNNFTEPQVFVEPSAAIEYNNFLNKYNIDYQYYRFIKKTIAIFFYVFVLFGCLLYTSLCQLNIITTTIVGVFLLFFIFVFFGIVLINNNKRKQLHKNTNTEDGSNANINRKNTGSGSMYPN